MAFEVIRGEELRIVMSVLAQTAYGTRLTDGNFNAGLSPMPNVATVGDFNYRRVNAGARPYQGDEWNRGLNERIIAHDSSLSLAFDASSFMVGWALAFLLGDVTSVQEGATTHYTHDIIPVDPMVLAATRDAFVTSVYIDTNGPDATRLRRVIQDLAVPAVTLSGRRLEPVQLAIDMLGSGIEVTNPTITIPALISTFQHFAWGDVTLEYGTKGGALTDISERLDEWSIRFNANLDADGGYIPGSGLYRGQMKFINRSFSIDLALKADRASRDIIDDMLLLTRKELLFTIDSGVLAGTGTANHKVAIRFPDVRIAESPLSFADSGAVYAVRVPEDHVFRDLTIADSPVAVTVDNITPYYLAAP